MRRARPVPEAAPLSCGVGQVNAVQSVLATKEAPNPNLALSRFLKPEVNGTAVFDSVSWTGVSWSDVSWDAVSWADVSWADVSWADVSWSDVSWADVSWEDNAEGETPLATDGYVLTASEAQDAAVDPDLLTPAEKEALLSASSLLAP
jgi:hypothetical protein